MTPQKIHKTISLKAAFLFAWENLLENIGQFFLAFIVSLGEIIGLVMVMILLGLIFPLAGWFTYALESLRYGIFNIPVLIISLLFIVAIILSGIVYTLMQVRFLRICLNIYDKEEVSFNTWWPLHMLALLIVPAFWLYGLSTGLGFLFLIVPGIYIAVTWSFFDYIIVDERVGIITAFKESAYLTRGIKFQLIGFYIICSFIRMIPLVGIVLGVPFCKLAGTFIYRQLQEQSK